MARARGAGRQDAELRRNHRLPAQRARRNVAARAHGRRRAGAGKAAEPGRSGARGDPKQRRSALLLSGRQGDPRSSRGRSATCSRRCRRSSCAISAQYYEARMAVSERVAGHWTQVMIVRAQGRAALRAQVLGRREYRASAQGPAYRRSRRSRRAVRVHGRGDQRKIRPRHGQAVLGYGAARLAGEAGLVRRDGAQGNGLVGRQAAWRVPEDHGRLSHAARQARPGRAPRLFGRPGRRSACSSNRLPARRCRPAYRSRAASTSTRPRTKIS